MLRVDAIADLETARQVATLLEKENARLHARLKELLAEVARLRGEDGQKQLELELMKLQEQMALLQYRPDRGRGCSGTARRRRTAFARRNPIA